MQHYHYCHSLESNQNILVLMTYLNSTTILKRKDIYSPMILKRESYDSKEREERRV